jgi:hypothetical protein
VNALGYYELYVNGKKVDDYTLAPAVVDYSKRNWYMTHDITSYLVQGRNTLALWLGRGWYVRGHPGVVYDGPLVRAQFDIEQSGGKPVGIATDATWKAKASPITPLGKGTAFGDYGGERYDARLEVDDWNGVKLDDSTFPLHGATNLPPALRPGGPSLWLGVEKRRGRALIAEFAEGWVMRGDRPGDGQPRPPVRVGDDLAVVPVQPGRRAERLGHRLLGREPGRQRVGGPRDAVRVDPLARREQPLDQLHGTF